jgi:RNA polymerase sigma-70 factor (ECF subfamily)
LFAFAEGLLQERFSFDADYLRRLGDGDDATEDHFARYFGELIRFKAAARLRSPQLADDVCQETLLRVFRSARAGVIEQPERLGAYVNTVCNNVILEIFRRDWRLSQLPDDAAEISSGAASAEAELVQTQRRDLLKRTLDQMEPKDRELLRRIFLDENDKDAVCKDLNVSRDYLRVLLHRARGRLRIAVKGRGRAAV